MNNCSSPDRLATGGPVASRRGAGNSCLVPMLVRHPDTPPGAIRAVEADVERFSGGVVATFKAIGDVQQLVIPPPVSPCRADDLWRTTCFEIFVGGDGSQYREFNLSPSGAWAAYGFDDYRRGMRGIDPNIEIESCNETKALTVTAKIESEFPLPSWLGLTAVIEEQDGIIRYWATAFAPGEPDFHAASTRSLILDGVSAQ